MLIILQFLPEASFEKEHENGNYHEENKKICAISFLIPNSKSFEKEKRGNKQISKFKIFKKLHHSFSLLLFVFPHWYGNEN